jgi:DNA-directed RNA polymerase subunit RPC12/RpoP
MAMEVVRAAYRCPECRTEWHSKFFYDGTVDYHCVACTALVAPFYYEKYRLTLIERGGASTSNRS